MPRSLTRNAHRPLVGRRRSARSACPGAEYLSGVRRQLGQHGGQAGPVAERLGQVARAASQHAAGGAGPRAARRPRARSASTRSNGPGGAPPTGPSSVAADSSRSTSRASSPARCPITRTASRRSALVERVPVVGERVRVPLDDGDRRAQLVAGHRDEQVAVVVAAVLVGDVAEGHHPRLPRCRAGRRR